MEFDLLISGAGPAGLCLARALADTGLTIGLVEQQPEEALREADFDGREIALTQRSASPMRELACGNASRTWTARPSRRCAMPACSTVPPPLPCSSATR